MLNLPSDRPEFSDFSEYFLQEIAPWLASQEQVRLQALKKATAICGAAVIVGLIGFFLVPAGFKMHVLIIGGIATAALGSWQLSAARHAITEGLIGRIATRLGFDYRRAMERPDWFGPFDTLKFFPSYNREAWEDEVRGVHNGRAFRICEADLKYRSSGKNTSTRTVFHGQLLEIEYSKRFLGTTVLRRDTGMLNRFGKPGPSYQKVGLASAKFEKTYEAWSTDQVEARDLLDPLVLERFEELERLFEGKNLQASFTDGKLLIAIATGDRLSMGSMFEPLHGQDRVETILKEFDAIFDLMDIALKPVDRPLNGALTRDQLRAARSH